jgi:16S rRNA A1518/A1519 N6-dimethyltransferase RsmA/KsgA/DIM1 with predicted DNA glycosylase/AP lyase activity
MMIVGSFLVVILLLIVLTFVWPPDSPWSPWWRTNKEVARAACRLAKVSNKDIVYELGSGDGEFILTAAKEFKCKKAIGIEIEITRHLISRIKLKKEKIKNAKFIREDFKKIKLNDATVVYFYLVPAVIKRIMPKLKKELKQGTRIVSLKYEVPMPLVKDDKKNGLYLYKI